MPGIDIGKILINAFMTMVTQTLDGFFAMVAKLIYAPQALPQFANDMYNIFLGAGASLMTAIVAFKIVQLMCDISNDNAQTTVGELLSRTIKASAMVVISPLLLKFLVGEIAYPLGDFMFSQISKNTSTAVQGYITSSGISEITSGTMLLILMGFIALAVVFFFFKMCVYQVDLILLLVLSVPASISMCADDNSYMGVWWREVISQITTILVQTLCMVGVTWVLTNKFTWYNFMILIGCGVNLIRGPKFLHTMWYSTGSGRAATNIGGKLATRMTMVKSLFK